MKNACYGMEERKLLPPPDEDGGGVGGELHSKAAQSVN